MKFQKLLLVFFITLSFSLQSLVLPPIIKAEPPLPVGGEPIDSPLGGGLTTNLEESVGGLDFFQPDLGVFITNTVKIAIITGSIIALLFLIWGGIDWITSGGDKAKYEAARDKITAAIFGLGLLASAFVIWTLVNYFFGIDKAIRIERNVPDPTPYTSPYGAERPWDQL